MGNLKGGGLPCLSRQCVSFSLDAQNSWVGSGSFDSSVVLGVDLKKMVEHDEQHGGASKEDGERVEGGVGDHGCSESRVGSCLMNRSSRSLGLVQENYYAPMD